MMEPRFHHTFTTGSANKRRPSHERVRGIREFSLNYDLKINFVMWIRLKKETSDSSRCAVCAILRRTGGVLHCLPPVMSAMYLVFLRNT